MSINDSNMDVLFATGTTGLGTIYNIDHILIEATAPEPASAALFSLGLLTLFRRRR